LPAQGFRSASFEAPVTGVFALTPSIAVSIESTLPMQARLSGLAEAVNLPNSQIRETDSRQPERTIRNLDLTQINGLMPPQACEILACGNSGSDQNFRERFD